MFEVSESYSFRNSQIKQVSKKIISEQARKINLDKQTIPTHYRALQRAFQVKASKKANSPSFEDTNSTETQMQTFTQTVL